MGKQWFTCTCGYGWAWKQAVANGQETYCNVCGRSWAKQIAKRKKEREAKAEQASWNVPAWPVWTPPKGGGNQGTPAGLGKVNSGEERWLPGCLNWGLMWQQCRKRI